MPYGTIGFRSYQAQSSTLPSPSVFGDSIGEEARTLGVGYTQTYDWKGVASLPGLPAVGGSVSTATAFSYDRAYDSALQIHVGSSATSTNTIAIYTNPLGIAVPNGYAKLKMEAIVNIQQITNNEMFVGFAPYSTISTGVITGGSSTSLVAQSMVGFWMYSTNPQNFDAIFQSTTGGINTVLSSTLNASAFNSTTQTQFQGAQTGTGNTFPSAPGPLAASTFVKLGLTFDPGANGAWTWYVNGVQVAKITALGSTDNSSTTSYGPIIACGGAASTVSYDVTYFRGDYVPSN